MAKLLDANSIIRFLVEDIPEQANETALAIYGGAFTKEAVVSEVVYVLCGVYKLSRSQVAQKLFILFELVEIENPDVMAFALKTFSETSLDFVDCLLIAYNNIQGIEIFSFDKKLNKHLA